MRNPRSRGSKKSRTLHLGEWIRALGRKPTELAQATGWGEPYISLLISGKKDGPSSEFLLDASEWLGVSVNQLYEPPPSPALLKEISGLRLDQIAVLKDLIDSKRR